MFHTMLPHMTFLQHSIFGKEEDEEGDGESRAESRFREFLREASASDMF